MGAAHLPQLSEGAPLRGKQLTFDSALGGDCGAKKTSEKTSAGAGGSKLLSLIAQKAGSDPFVKVKKMIREMITKLMESIKY